METIPSITKSQVKLMVTVCTDAGMGIFSQCSAKDSDSTTDKILMAEAASDVDAMASLGFIKEITADHSEQLVKQSELTGRKWRIFQVEPLGRAIFQAYCSPTLH